MSKKYDVALVGGRSLVLQHILKLLKKRSSVIERITIYASKDGVESLKSDEYQVKEMKFENIASHDFAFFSGGDLISLKYAARFMELGATVIDNSSIFRLNQESKLIAMHVNDEDRFEKGELYCNPNCVTIMVARVLKPLHDLFKMEKVIVATYQAASGMGKKALEGFLKEQASPDFISGFFPNENVKKRPLFNNILPLIGTLENDGYTSEEYKIRHELKKIFHDPELESSITAVRVPLTNGHSSVIHVTFEREVDVTKALEALQNCEGIKYQTEYCCPLDATGSEDVFVSRFRRDLDCPYALTFFASSDNLLVGAASNALYIFDLLVQGENIK